MRDAAEVPSTAEILDELDRRGISRSEVARVLGISQPNATKLWRPDSRTGKTRVLGADEASLLTAHFRLFNSPSSGSEKLEQEWAQDAVVTIKRVDLSYAMGDGTNLEDYPEEEDVRFDAGFVRRITRAPAHRLFVARGDGDSMFPTLINDDEVVIDTTQRILNMQDRIWACAFRGAGMIKRLRIVGDQQVEIRSDNQTVPPQTVSAEDLHIVGRVIWVGRRV